MQKASCARHGADRLELLAVAAVCYFPRGESAANPGDALNVLPRGKRNQTLIASGRDTHPDPARLRGIISAFRKQVICVVGDFVLDEFVSGEISRVSREAPVLILRHRETHTYPGGGANAVVNLAELGARVLPVGVVGDDAGGEAILEHFRRRRIDLSGISRAPGWTTTTKTRYLAGWTHTTEQQVLRVDRESRGKLPKRVRALIETNAKRLAMKAGAILVSDYGLGTVTPALVGKLGAKIVTLDSRYRLLDFRGSHVTAATPNEPELEAAYQARVGTEKRKLEELGRRALSELGLMALVVTRGKDGLAVFERGAKAADARVVSPETDGDTNESKVTHIPIYGSDTPVDVTGAGDTVIAVFTLALAAGATYLEAAHLANFAGGIVVMKPRTATLTRGELEAALEFEKASTA